MNLELNNQLFIVGGAGSGFGHAIAESLIKEGARVIAVARGKENLEKLRARYPDQVETVSCDLSEISGIDEVLQVVGKRQLHGILVNAGGPPAKTVMETTLEDWDQSYKMLLRWKVYLTQQVMPAMKENNYGRFVFIESSAVKQPLENLVLSNSIRLAVVGFVKTFSQEVAHQGITMNVLAPGSHDTAAMERIFRKKSEQTGLSPEEAKKAHIEKTPVGALGSAKDFATLATWLLSPLSRYITGETISVDGGVIKGTFG
jgi:3-oxoacyl-[acyl-carrier protein] reductase